jgi:serine/threonine-protein kinase
MTVGENALLLGRYRLHQSVGRGGMADVYLAFDSERQARVAIKVLREDLAEDPDFVRRFQREAEALAKLDHPNIVRFYAFEQDGPIAFIVMDFVDGTTLRRYLLDHGALSAAEITPLLRDVRSALHYAHLKGFTHRDLKPGNVMLKRDGTALLTDFGIARAVEGSTMTVAVIGTPAYMSPEQIQGHPVDARSDIYSFGVMLFELATGRRPFTGDEPGLTRTGTTTRLQEAHLRLAPPDPRSLNRTLPPAAATVILKALSKDPAERYGDAVSLGRAWDAAVGVAETMSAPPVGPVGDDAPPIARPRTATPAAGRAPVAGRRRLGLILGISLAVMVAAVAGLIAVLSAPRPETASVDLTPPAVAVAVATATASATPAPSDSPTPRPTATVGRRSGGVQVAGAGASPTPAGGAEASTVSGGVAAAAPAETPTREPATPSDTPSPEPTPTPSDTPSPQPTATPALAPGLVVFGSDRAGFAHVFSVRGDGKGLRQITGGGEYFWNPALSDDGKLLTYVSKVGGNTEVFIAGSDGRNAMPVSKHPAEDDHPAFFPDNVTLAYASRRDGGWDIYRSLWDGSDVRRLTSDGVDNRFVAVSPKGQIAYVSQNAGYPTIELMVMDGDGSGRRVLYSYASGKQRDDPGRFIYRPDWSPDGGSLLFGADDDNDGLISVLRIDANTGAARRIVADGNGPAWSPEGARLIYKPAGARQILFVADANGNRLYQLTGSAYNAWSPDWAR